MKRCECLIAVAMVVVLIVAEDFVASWLGLIISSLFLLYIVCISLFFFLFLRTDVWALGCLFFAYQFGYSPFECNFHQSTGAAYVVESSYLRILGKIPRPPRPSAQELAVLDLVEWMLVSVPDFRPTTAEVTSKLASMNYGNDGNV